MNRKEFIQTSFALGAAGFFPSWLRAQNPANSKETIMTVLGPIPASQMGFTLSHEHIMADFIGAEKYSRSRYNAQEVMQTALPFIKEIQAKGVSTFVDCTPAYLGRDAALLKKLAETTGMQFLTTTGYYGAVNEKFVPAHAYKETAQQLAQRWIAEWKNGIEGTAVKPGLIKTSTDKGPLTPMQRKLIQAAGITHLATGLTIAVHSGDGAAAFEQLDILQKQGVSPQARIWVHAQNETDKQLHVKAAQLTSWVSFDGVNPDSMKTHLEYLQHMKENQLLNRVLVSQDSGWYNVGDPGGGNFRPYSCISNQFVPLLKQNGFTDAELDLIFKTNPAKAFAIQVRKL